MGLIKFLLGIFDDDTEEIEDELHDIYGYSENKLFRMSDQEKKDSWYEEEAEEDD